MVCAGVSGPKHYATFRHFQHETPDAPTHLCIHITALFSVSLEKVVLSNEGSGRIEITGKSRNAISDLCLTRASTLAHSR